MSKPDKQLILIFSYILQEKDIKDLTDEIRKLKAIIVKHENRIRALEAQNKTIQEDVEFLKGDSTPSATLNMRDDGHMAPDEV